MRVSVLNRGGLAVFGGSYDAKCDESVFDFRQNDEIAVTVEYPSAPTDPSVTSSGMTATGTAVSDNKVTTTFIGISDGARADLSATVGGVTKVIRLRARSSVQPDGYDGGDGVFVPEVDYVAIYEEARDA